MSLRDTIEAARREAQEAGGLLSGNKNDSAAQSDDEGSGFSRRSAARAKPTRNAAQSVRVVSAEDAKAGRSGKRTSEMTKEERKAERAAQREIDDLRNMAANALLKKDPEYSFTQRVWWIALGLGFAMTLASFGLNWLMQRNASYATNLYAGIAIVSLVLAYVFIIGAFIFDLVKARPIRKRVDAEVHGMTRKHLEQILREDALERDAKRASK